MQKTSLIELRGVSKTYQSDGTPVTALHPAELAVGKGEFICIAGPSGSGKTTILNIMGLIDAPTSGAVLFEGIQTSRLSRSRLAKLRLSRIGFIFQSHNLIPVLSAYENVEYVLLLKGVPARKRRDRVFAALRNVGLEREIRKRPPELSGGEQQRVAVARAIVSCPSFVLADEPTASLDSANGENLIDLLQSLSKEEGTTFVFSSHDPRVISRAGRIITLHDGKIV
jgi:putative ABC transport system ATP-binding protein